MKGLTIWILVVALLAIIMASLVQRQFVKMGRTLAQVTEVTDK